MWKKRLLPLLLAVLLTGCAAKERTLSQKALDLRTGLMEAGGCTFTAAVTADLGGRVYPFTLDCAVDLQGETTLTVVEPEWMAGVTARMTDEEAVLEYDGAGMTLGTLNGDGLSPIAAIPEMLDQVAQGYIAQCSWAQEVEDTFLELTCRDPEQEQGAGTEYTMWFEPDTFDLRMAEVQVEGVTVLTVTSDDFTMEMNEDESTDHADLDGDPSGQFGA